MTNDTNTLNGALTELGETMADNLVAMGVADADASDGLTTLAQKILDVEPSIHGLDLNISVTLSGSPSTIITGQSVVLTSKLTASYDDETLVNVDLSGVLTGANILFKEGNTIIGTGITDTNGTATATINTLSIGTHSIKAVFAGTDNFDGAESTPISIVVTAPEPAHFSLVKTAGKDILSYADRSSGDEYCTVTATVTDANNQPCEGETVDFSIAGSTVKSDETDSNGQVSYTYQTQGVGDVTIESECNLLQETYVLEDLLLYRSSVTNNDTFDVALPNHFQITQTVTKNSSSSSYCYGLLTNYQYGVLREKGSLSVRIGTNNPFADNNTTIIQLNTPTVMTYEFDNGLHKCSANNTTVSGTNTQYSIGSFTGMTITQYTVTDLKIKPL